MDQRSGTTHSAQANRAPGRYDVVVLGLLIRHQQRCRTLLDVDPHAAHRQRHVWLQRCGPQMRAILDRLIARGYVQISSNEKILVTRSGSAYYRQSRR